MNAFINSWKFLERIVKATIKPRPLLQIWKWLEKNVNIPIITGAVNPGPFRTWRFPVYRGLWDIIQQPHIREFTYCASARVGKTLLSICYLLWRISERPGPVLWLDPTRKTAMRVARQEIDPFFRECAPVWEKAIVSRTTWTSLEKQFRGMIFRIVGSGSPADLAGYQAETLFINECDNIRASIDAQAASADLAIARTKQFNSTRMILRNSTPTIEDGLIWQEFQKGSQHYCYIACPHCQHMQRLTFMSETKDVPFDEAGVALPTGQTRTETTGYVKFSQFKIVESVEVVPGTFEDIERGYNIDAMKDGATYVCAGCKVEIESCERNEMLEKYEWRAHNPRAPKDHISAHIWAAYSPFENLGTLAAKYIQCKADPNKLQDFWNLDLGLPYIRHAAAIVETDIDRCVRRCPRPYLRGQLPFEPRMITMTVDVQGWGFWWTIRAWGLTDDETQQTWSALVDWGEAVSWEQIEEFAGLRADGEGKWNRYKFKTASGEVKEFSVNAGLVDSGFEAKENKNVYEFCKRWEYIFSPSKGGDQSKTRGATIRSSPILDDTLELVWYWDDWFKGALYTNCIKYGNSSNREPLNWWLPTNIDNDYRRQHMNEKREEVKGRLHWVTRGDNHLADCEKMHEVMRGKIEELFDSVREEGATVDSKAKA